MLWQSCYQNKLCSLLLDQSFWQISSNPFKAVGQKEHFGQRFFWPVWPKEIIAQVLGTMWEIEESAFLYGELSLVVWIEDTKFKTFQNVFLCLAEDWIIHEDCRTDLMNIVFSCKMEGFVHQIVLFSYVTKVLFDLWYKMEGCLIKLNFSITLPRFYWSRYWMVFYHPISGTIFKWSTKLDHLNKRKTFLWHFSYKTV
jgi:hypothetical protein